MSSQHITSFCRLRIFRQSALLFLIGMCIHIHTPVLAQNIDPDLRVEIARQNQNLILSWFASNSVPYQVESSTTLSNWIDASLVLTGRGAVLFNTNPLGRLNRQFYRVQRLVTPSLITATFDPLQGTLTIVGDAQANVIAVSRNAAGQLLVNNGSVRIQGGTPTVANTTLIRILGQDGDDQLLLDETGGALPRSEMQGEGGNDTLTGGSGPDTLDGGPGNDTLLGKGGPDKLFGRTGNDILTGGDADDELQGNEDDDRIIWNPGDDTDLVEGGPGTDSMEVNGGNGSETFTTTANGARVRFDRVDPAPFSLDLGSCENLVVQMNGGNDSFAATGNLASLIRIAVDGGAGNDTILGGNGPDTLAGGDDNDFVDGQQGNDVILLGAGDDVVQWDPGDGNDTVEGQAGTDRLVFNGSAANEIYDLASNGNRVRFLRNIANINMDLNGLEILDLNALAGTDSITVNDMTGTELTTVNCNLSGSIAGATGDGASDLVTIHGTATDDVVNVFGSGTSVSVLGLSATVHITNSEAANDSVAVNTLAGNDSITASTLPAGVILVSLDGGEGNDTLLGSQGADVFRGGSGNDLIIGDNGNDVAFMGADDDVFQWNPGDGNDTIEGQDGQDRLIFFGSNASEIINVIANGGRILFTRDIANVTMDLNDLENLEFKALAGADGMVIGDLSGTDLTAIRLDLAGPGGGGDGAVDTVTLNGTQGADNLTAQSGPDGLSVTGLAATVTLVAPESAADRLTLNGLGGDDVMNATALNSNAPSLTMNGGIGNDVLIGSARGDLINGGDGNDTALMGGGDDTFVWNPGDDNDVVEGQTGIDTLLFNGANAAENISISATGGRVSFTRNIANVVLDLNDVESIDFNALGGSDFIQVTDLSGTDVQVLNLNLASTQGGIAGDGAVDTVTVQGTAGDDVILANTVTGGISISRLHAQVNILGSEASIDRLNISGLGGDDVIDATSLLAGSLLLTADGGTGNDILLGGAGPDTLLGGDNDDVLLGGPGNDILDGGSGDNISIQDGSLAAPHLLTLFGDAQDNSLKVSRNAAGELFLNGASLPGFTVANTPLIRIYGLAGADTLTLDESNGALPPCLFVGGSGNDTLIGGSSADLLFGGGQNDTVQGKGGADFLFGGADNDTLTGGDADDQMFGESGNDRTVWNPGDDTDLAEGGAGTDTVEVNGGNGDEVFTTTANGTRVRFDRLNPAPFSIDIGASENLVVNMNGGKDSFSATGNLAPLIRITVDGGAGDDTLLGSNGADVLLGGDDNDFVDGQQGNDTALLGSGDDTFQWDPGDGNDIVEGQAGEDTLRFNGSAANEIFQITPNGGRVIFSRNIANIIMDLDDVETIDLNTLGGADAVTVNSLAATDLSRVNVDLAGTLGGAAGDASADSITVNGTSSADVFSANAKVGVIGVIAPSLSLRIDHSEVANDKLILNGLGGVDVFTVAPGVNALIGVTTNQ